jgi:hypothetical protein
MEYSIKNWLKFFGISLVLRVAAFFVFRNFPKTVGNYLMDLEKGSFLKSVKIGKEKLYVNHRLMDGLEGKSPQYHLRSSESKK